MGVTIILCVLGALLVLVAVLLARALSCAPSKDAKRQLKQEETDRAREYAQNLSKLIQVETVSVRGDEDKTKFLALHKVLEEVFPNIHRVCEKTEIRGNLLFKWAGKKSDKPIMLMSHHDVVEANGSWKYPPFSGEIAEGKVWGRGTQDTKGSRKGCL